MAAGSVHVEFTADGSGAVREITRINGELVEVRQQMVSVGDRSAIMADESGQAMRQMIAQADRVGDQFQLLSRQARSAGGGMRNMAGANTQINQLLLESGYVAQDAAFGFRGIANNIPGVVRAFNSARAAAGSTNALLSSLASSITGPAGVLFATNALVGILTVATMQFDLFSGSVDEADKSLEDLREELDLEGELRIVTEETKGWQRELQNLETIALSLAQTIGRPLLEPMFAWLRLTRDINVALARGLAQAVDQSTGNMLALETRFDQLTDTVETNERVTGDWIATFRAINEQFQKVQELDEEAAQALSEAMRESIREMEVGGDLRTVMERAIEDLDGLGPKLSSTLIPPDSVLGRKLSEEMSGAIEKMRTGPVPLEELLPSNEVADRISQNLSQAAEEAGIALEDTGEKGANAGQIIQSSMGAAASAIRALRDDSADATDVLSVLLSSVATVFSAIPGFGLTAGILGGSGQLVGAFEHGGRVDTPFQIVGESGPELAMMPRNTQIASNETLNGALQQLARGGGRDRIHVTGRLVGEGGDLVAVIDEQVRLNGRNGQDTTFLNR